MSNSPIEFSYANEDSIPQDLLCALCVRPFINPVEHDSIGNGKCSQIYCKSCAEGQKLCPHCRNTVQKWNTVPSTPTTQRFFFNLLNELKVVCHNCQNRTISRSDLAEHIQRCPIDCTFGCGMKIAPKDQKEHENDCAAITFKCLAADVMCPWSGQKKDLKPHTDKCVFFQIKPILNLQQQQINLQNKRISQLENFINTLESSINNEFIPGPNYTLSNNNKTATKSVDEYEWNANVLGKRFSKGHHQWTIKFTKVTSQIYIGVAPYNLHQKALLQYNSGWYLYSNNSTLRSGPPMNYIEYKYSNTGRLVSGSTVTVKLDMYKKSIAFIINGVDYGEAYKNIPTDLELCPCVLLCSIKDCVEIM